MRSHNIAQSGLKLVCSFDPAASVPNTWDYKCAPLTLAKLWYIVTAIIKSYNISMGMDTKMGYSEKRVEK
jgi:hypothetical protein